MPIRLQANATTKPAQRAYLPASARPAAKWAEELGASKTTACRWRAQDVVQDRPLSPPRLTPIALGSLAMMTGPAASIPSIFD
jgi:hypothetical protein